MDRFVLFIVMVWMVVSSSASGTDGNLTLASCIITGKSPVHQFKLEFNQNAIPQNLVSRASRGGVNQSRIRFKIPVYQIQGDNTMITKDFRDMVGMKDYPDIVLDYDTEKLSFLWNGNVQSMAFDLTIAQTTKSVTASVVIEYDKDRGIFELQGKLFLDMKDFGLKPPVKFFGLMKVSDNVDIEFKLIFDPGLNKKNVISDVHAAIQ